MGDRGIRRWGEIPALESLNPEGGGK